MVFPKLFVRNYTNYYYLNEGGRRRTENAKTPPPIYPFNRTRQERKKNYIAYGKYMEKLDKTYAGKRKELPLLLQQTGQ